MLEGLAQIAARRGVRLPATLALAGKAFAQMQLATTALDPSLDPFAMVGRFMLRDQLGKIRSSLDPQRAFYESQKLRLRLTRLLESVERVVGARPGGRLQVEFHGAAPLETAIRNAGRRLALGLVTGCLIVAGGLTAASATAASWIPAVLFALGGALAVALLVDVLRR
jgi:hypothetical protein